MDLGNAWHWDTRKLACKIRPESGNPAIDEIRERLSALVGVPVPQVDKHGNIISQDQKGKTSKATKGPMSFSTHGNSTANGNNATSKAGGVAGGATKRSMSVGKLTGIGEEMDDTTGANAVDMARFGLTEKLLKEFDDTHGHIQQHQKNIHKRFFQVPRNPPLKIITDMQQDILRQASAPNKLESFGPLHNNKKGIEERRAQREKRKSKKDPKKVDTRRQREASNTLTQTKTPKNIFKPYQGDKFGTGGNYMGGMVYLSRLPPAEHTLSRLNSSNSRMLGMSTRDESAKIANASETRNDDTSLFGSSMSALDDSTLNIPESEESLKAKIHCAKTLCQWAEHKANAQRLSEEGAVAAIIALTKESNETIRAYCALALKHMSNSHILAKDLIRMRVVSVVSELANAANKRLRGGANDAATATATGSGSKDGASDEQRQRKGGQRGEGSASTALALEDPRDVDGMPDAFATGMAQCCAVTLVNLSKLEGVEADLVEDGIVLAFMSIMNHHEDLAQVCARGLFNLTCVDAAYTYIERVVKAFISLASSAVAAVKHVCASGLCNLSDLVSLRGRLVEEGIVQCMTSLARGAEQITRRVCAIIIHTLALSPSTRVDLVAKGAVQLLYALSSDEDTITLHYIASAITRLAMVEQNITRLMNENGVVALCNICMRCPSIASTTQLCSAALQLLSQRVVDMHTSAQAAQALAASAPIQAHSHAPSHAGLSVHGSTLVVEGCVPALVTLLRESSDAVTLKHSLFALCCLLRIEDNHLAIIQQGGVQSVITLSDHSEYSIREACALALLNLSNGDVAKDHQVIVNAIPAIIALASTSMDPKGDGPSVSVRMMTRCAGALCKLAANVTNVPLMVDNGVVPAMISMLKTNNPVIVKQCCAALCCLAHEGSACVMIAEGATPLIIKGATDGDSETQHACCAVLSIISSHEQCRRQLCNMGALPCLIRLAHSNDATTRLRCAVAFANLSFEYTVQGLMVENDIVSVVRDLSSPSPSYDNRKIDVNSVAHTSDDDNAGQSRGDGKAMPEGHPQAQAHPHDSSYSEENQLYCAKALCNLGCHVGSESKLIEQGGVQALMMICMVRAVSQFTKQVCAKALLNLLTVDHIKTLVDQDLVNAISSLCKRPPEPKKDDETLLKVCAEIFCVLSANDYGREKLIEKISTLENVFTLTRSSDPHTQAIVAKIACNLVNFSDSMHTCVRGGVIDVLKQMCTMNVDVAACSKAFLLLSGKQMYRASMVKAQIVPLLILLAKSTDKEIMANCTMTLANLAYHSETRSELVKTGCTKTAVDIVLDRTSSGKGFDETVDTCLRVVMYMSVDPDTHVSAVRDRVIPAFLAIAKATTTGKVRELGPVCDLVGATMLNLVSTTEALEGMEPEAALAVWRFITSYVAPQPGSPPNNSPIADRLATYAAVILYRFSQNNKFRDMLCAQEGSAMVEMFTYMNTLAAHEPSQPHVIATILVLSVAPKHRPVLVDNEMHAILLTACEKLDQGTDAEAQTTLENATVALHNLAKSAQLREALVESSALPILIRLSKNEKQTVKFSASETLKLLSADSGEGIEEGTVATLIAMSFNGANLQATTSATDDYAHAAPRSVSLDMEVYDLPEHIVPAVDEYFEPYTVVAMKHPGGAAGQGPAPPEPPAMQVEDNTKITIKGEDGAEIAAEGDEEEQEPGDKIMMFAKMDVPPDMDVTDPPLPSNSH